MIKPVSPITPAPDVPHQPNEHPNNMRFYTLSDQELNHPLIKECKIYVPPKPVGYWKIGSHMYIEVVKKPRWLTRVMMRAFFEIEWLAYPEPKS